MKKDVFYHQTVHLGLGCAQARLSVGKKGVQAKIPGTLRPALDRGYGRNCGDSGTDKGQAVLESSTHTDNRHGVFVHKIQRVMF